MNKHFLIALIFTSLVHGLLLVSLDDIFPDKKAVFSNNLGEASIKLQFRESRSSSNQKVGKTKNKKNKKTKNRSSNRSKKKIQRGSNKLMAKYLDSVKIAIAKNHQKSTMAKRLNLSGRVELEFLIKRPNTITNVKVKTPSPYKVLDESATYTLQNAKNIPSIPATIDLEEVPLTLFINYN